ncbi:MAG: bifunctional folylpolyglutamate synthase/dihydrofolate synthase [Desulfobulbaceae bacterium]|nr:bifunctional folylpolyglutamate synthase/dihydrofolate synthase [Desulfobulbaceae bacterium]
MNYQEAWSFLDLLQFHKIKLGLDSMNHFLGALDNPQHRVPCVHIGGTNGKGSVGSTLLSILSKAGYRVGLYTSPHLSSVRERFRINDEYISQEQFAEQASRIRDILDGGQITYFEFTTTLAMLWFAEQKVDLVLLEVGMGGRLDATNVVTPLVSVITNVSMDHEAYLGNTLREVAGEKAGIIKPSIPLVSAAGPDESREVIMNTCAQVKAPLYLLGRDFHALAANNDENSTWTYSGIDIDNKPWELKELPMALSGNYQLDNGAVALAVLQLLSSKNFTIKPEDIREGLQGVSWPGRLESFYKDEQGVISQEKPRDNKGTRHFLLDGAHNPAGVEALHDALEQSFTRNRLILVWGAMGDKNIHDTLATIAPLAHTIIFTQPESERSATPEHLRATLATDLQERAICIESVAEAIERAESSANDEDLICIAGSLYLVGAARSILRGELTDDE